MIIEESVLISADIETIWTTFTDLTCWAEWNTVASKAASDSGRIEEGARFSFCLRPFSVPIVLEPMIEEVVPREKVVWTGTKFGIFSRHEFLFQQVANGVLVTSRETFRGLPLLFGGVTFPEAMVRELTVGMLSDLKKAAEKYTSTP
ncbi:MAG: SRPBCC family protein [Nitrospirota bacterium]